LIPRILLAQIGARRSYAVPRILYRAGLLHEFHTDIVTPQFLSRFPLKWIEHFPDLKRLQNREVGIPHGKIVEYPRIGYEYWLRRKRSKSETDLARTFNWVGTAFCRRVLRHGLAGATAVHCFDGAALEIFQQARTQKLTTILEQTQTPYAIDGQLMRVEEAKFPGWRTSAAPESVVAARARRQIAEWQLADVILCGSNFVKKGIRLCGGPVEKCTVVPYGVLKLKRTAGPRPLHRPLRVLTVGRVELRKGSHLVLEAAKRLGKDAEFRMVGPICVDDAHASLLSQHVKLWGGVPRREVAEHYAWADVFLLPSISEGSAGVCYESLAEGLPLIVSENTGSVIENGVQGFITSAGDADSIVQAICRLKESPGLHGQMSENASLLAAQYTIEGYSERLLAAVLGGQFSPSSVLKDLDPRLTQCA
jgi:glycosyltransferase involved in cell wall biosynthesis